MTRFAEVEVLGKTRMLHPCAACVDPKIRSKPWQFVGRHRQKTLSFISEDRMKLFFPILATLLLTGCGGSALGYCLTTSPMLIMPASFPSWTTGMWRMRCWVIRFIT